MEIYQGEPMGFKITIKNDAGQYLSDLSSIPFEALIKDAHSETKHTWSSAKQTITYGSYTEGGVTIGYAAFGLTGAETSMMLGTYAIEVAKIISSGRAIGIVNQLCDVLPANIKNGL